MVHLPPGGALVPVTDTDVHSFDDQSIDEDRDATEHVGVAPFDGVHAVDARVDANKEGSGPAQFPGTSDSTSIMDDTAADVKTALALDHMSSMNVPSESPMPSEPLVSQAQERVEEASSPIASSPIAASRSFLDRQSALSADEQQQQMQQPIDDIFLFGRPQLLFGFVKIVMMILSLYVSLWITNYAFLEVLPWLKVRRKCHSIVMRTLHITAPVLYLLAVYRLSSIPGGNIQLRTDSEVVGLVEGNLR